jgi:Asp-tRNA(Asn)/Glu-tRNA(Gln) amidotransferase A subunit family amidase
VIAPGPLTRLSSAVREGRLRASDLVEESLRRLDAAATLNVTVLVDVERALDRARALDEGLVERGALAGAPALVKDLEDWVGHPTRMGSLALASADPALANGVVPGRLEAAGATLLGKSTLPEFAIEGFTASRATGVTRNPWNLDLSPGGSSGGSAAALAAGLVLVATATDGGGSVRIPASLCGLVGLKPTNGAFGRWPAPDWIDYSTDGPLATSADDLALLYDVLVGPVPGDPGAPPRRALDHEVRWPARLVAAERTTPRGPQPAGVATALTAAVEALGDLLGVPVEWRTPDSFFAGGDPDLDWFTITSAEHVASLGRRFVEENMDLFHPATVEYLEAGLHVDIDDYLGARRRRYHYVRALDELLGDATWLVTPTVASEGWLADGRLDAHAEVHGLPPSVYSTAVQNVVGLPAISLPMGTLPTGLPFGVQVTAPRWRDRDLLSLAARVESQYPWPRCAPGYEPLDAAFDI